MHASHTCMHDHVELLPSVVVSLCAELRIWMVGHLDDLRAEAGLGVP